MKNINQYIIEKFKLKKDTLKSTKEGEYYLIPWSNYSILDEKYLIAPIDNDSLSLLFLLNTKEIYDVFLQEWGRVSNIPKNLYCYSIPPDCNINKLKKRNKNIPFDFKANKISTKKEDVKFIYTIVKEYQQTL